MNDIYPDDYEESIDFGAFKKAIEYLAPMCLNLDEIRNFRDAVVTGKKSIIKAAHY